MSSNSVILTSRNQNSSIPNQYVYNFPSTQMFKNHEISLLQFSIYNSFFNIEASRNNNNVTLYFNALIPTTHVFTFTDGFYSLSDLNYALQNFCVINDLYMVDVNGNNIYFVEILANAISYATQLNFYPIPTSAEATTKQWTLPPSATWNFPVAATTPQLAINESLGVLMGFDLGTYPSAPLNSNQQFLSNFAPTLSPISSVFLTCNLINSPYSNPSNIIGNTAITSAFGNLIIMKNSNQTFLSIIPANYNSIQINLLDQNFQNLKVIDREVVIVLVIKEMTKTLK